MSQASATDVLDAIHTAGVVHADIKSDNFLAEQRTDGDTVTLIDFGLARLDELVHRHRACFRHAGVLESSRL